jgi:hypothetical protein
MAFIAWSYSIRMRFLLSGIVLVFLASSATVPSFPQNPVQTAPAKAKDRYFTGTVMAIDDATLTVNRRVLGRNSSTKTFVITADTRFEGGRPAVGAQITVRYVTTDEGERAVHVILRRPPK